MVQAIIFDMDGVLIDSEPLHHEAERRMLAEFGITISTEELLTYMGQSTERLLKDFIQTYQLNTDYATLLSKHKANLNTIFENQVQTIAGIPEFLDLLSDRHIPFALASSSNLQLIQTVLNRFDWTDRFAVVMSGEHIENSKPAPDIFLETARKLGKTTDACIVIEDSNAGVRAGKAAAIRTIGFHSPNSHNQDISMADLEIDDFSPKTIQHLLKWAGFDA